MKQISKENLENLYITQKKSVKEITEMFGYKTPNPIYALFKKYKIQYRQKEIKLTYGTLYEEYVVKQKSTWTIGKENNCNHTTVLYTLKRFKIPLRTKTEALTENLINETFGKLKVVKQSDKNTNGKIHWECICDCGKETTVSATSLKEGKTKSCGCNKGIKNKYVPGAYFSVMRRGAKIRNLDFSISVEDIEKIYENQYKKCAISGIDIFFAPYKKGNTGTASVDRKDSTKGYTIDNIQIVHKDINLAKQAKSDEDFIRMCEIITTYQRNKNV
jgi:hypothetical protein